MVNDIKSIELCGVLKNVVAVGAGFVHALGIGRNIKTTIIIVDLVK